MADVPVRWAQIITITNSKVITIRCSQHMLTLVPIWNFTAWGRLVDAQWCIEDSLMVMTHTTRIRGVFDVALYSLQCFSSGPMHTASIFCQEFGMSRFYHSTTLLIMWFLCCNWLKLLYVSPVPWFSIVSASSSIHWAIYLYYYHQYHHYCHE